MSKPKTKEQMLNDFVSQVGEIAKYWATVDTTDEEKCEGVAFSIMNILDGTYDGCLCAVDLVLRPHEDDKEYNIDSGYDYVVDGMCINDEVNLHELLNK